MITLNAIEQRLRQFAENHFFIHSYGFGSPDEVDLDKYTAFPLLYVVYTGATYDDNKAYSFEVYVLDRPTEQEAKSENRREVVSDSEQCLEDLVADITTGFNIFQWDEAYNVEAASVSPIVDARTNVLSGALLDLTISVPYQYESCNLPIDGVQPQGGEISYARRGLLRILTQDGTTDVPSVNTIKVTNGTLTDEGDGIVSIDTGGVDILGDLENVNLDDPQDHEALVYDQDTATWINGASTKIGIRVINQTGGTLYAGTPLRATGVQGDQITVEIYNATQDGKRFIGLLSADIANGETGYARQTGTIYNLNTLRFNVGDILYPAKEIRITINNGLEYMDSSFGVTGPDEPFAKIPCAIVLRRHFTTGRIYVRTWTPSRNLEDLTNVYTVGKQVNDVLRWNGYQWTAGDQLIPSLNDLRDVEITNPELIPNKSLLRWDAFDGIWRVIPETGGTIPALPNNIAYFLGRYNDGASTARQAADATLTIERYLSVQADGHGEEVSAQTDTPTSGNKIIRKIWHKAVSFEDSDVSTWTLVHTFADDTAYNDTIATFNALLTAATYGSIPFTLAQTWEEAAAVSALLDGYTADLVGAFAPVLLDSTYAGDCMRIRRASDNAETDIGFDGIDLDTAAIATFCAGTNGFVKTWYNQDGSGNDLDQGTNADQAKIYDAATGVVLKDAINALDFASDDWMQSPAGVIGSVTGLSFAYVGAFKSTGTSNQIMFAASNGSYAGGDAWIALRQQGGLNQFTITSGVNNSINNGTADTSMHLFFGSFIGGSQLELSVDGTNATTSTAIASIALTAEVDVSMIDNSGSKLLKTNQFSAALVVWNADKSADRVAIETALNDYFNVY